MRRSATIIVGVLLACVVAAALWAPYVYGELEVWTQPHAILDSAPAQLSKGRMVGQAKAAGFYPRVFPVNDEMTLAAGFPWNNR